MIFNQVEIYCEAKLILKTINTKLEKKASLIQSFIFYI